MPKDKNQNPENTSSTPEVAKKKTEDKEPRRPTVVGDSVAFSQSSTNRYLVSQSRLLDIEGATEIFSSPFQDDIGESLVLVGCESHTALGEVEMGIQISMDGVTFTNTVAKTKMNLPKKGKVVDCLNMVKYRAPFYRLALKLEKPAPKGACIKFSFCAHN